MSAPVSDGRILARGPRSCRHTLSLPPGYPRGSMPNTGTVAPRVFHEADNLAIESAERRTLGQWSGWPAGIRPTRGERHAGRLLAGLARSGVAQHLRVHPPQVNLPGGEPMDTLAEYVDGLPSLCGQEPLISEAIGAGQKHPVFPGGAE